MSLPSGSFDEHCKAWVVGSTSRRANNIDRMYTGCSSKLNFAIN